MSVPSPSKGIRQRSKESRVNKLFPHSGNGSAGQLFDQERDCGNPAEDNEEESCLREMHLFRAEVQAEREQNP